MKQQEFCVADWGTSGFRLWRLSGAGEVLGVKRGALGMSRLQPEDYPSVLEAALRECGVCDAAPVVACGMVGAAQGWMQARYLNLPVGAGDLAAGALGVPHKARAVFILPGVARKDEQAPDVMRGEETILCGAIAEAGLNGRVCLPGTHCKWCDIEDARLVSFATSMTGEIFALLAHKAHNSTLSHFVPQGSGLETGEDVADMTAFRTAVGESLRHPQRILQALFSLRAGALLFGAGRIRDNAARLSGLLIGLEIAAQIPEKGEDVTLLASGTIAKAYQRALEIAGARVRLLDAEHFALRGLIHAAERILAKHAEEGAGR